MEHRLLCLARPALMEMFMKTLSAAVAIAIMLALLSVGETAAAQKQKKAKARYVPTTVQQYPQFSVPGVRTSAGTPCVRVDWRGCLGWDPDPFIRAQLDRDTSRDNR
jgi:hypothetical protein